MIAANISSQLRAYCRLARQRAHPAAHIAALIARLWPVVLPCYSIGPAALYAR
jgi:hypothetical protein